MFHFFEHLFGLVIAMDFLAQEDNPDWLGLSQKNAPRSTPPIGFQCAQMLVDLSQSPGILFDFVEQRGTSLAEKLSQFSMPIQYRATRTR